MNDKKGLVSGLSSVKLSTDKRILVKVCLLALGNSKRNNCGCKKTVSTCYFNVYYNYYL